MKITTGLLVLMIALTQYPLWFGKGGWLEIMEMHEQIIALHETNQSLQNRNTVLEAEVNNLKKGLDAIEELARSELGMIRRNELFFHVVEYENK
ncbi:MULTISPECIES: cell division protein FtsB [Nitrosomonas]|uniref:Cell division protein FtsB n=2 Tax=Nitrosomonas eutropha TaxID=916 RepID=A0ABX5M9H9_9PROT|nr:MULTISPECIES: cell division protein FtsB [Nitrosomonas]ABI60688.1 cell division protein FtsB [Nitrosomonas eutropha C91]MXS81166.1 cell division protein FtsB [Nitrosomonas sp. GH22]PXV80206.1 cell division protein FtsB [Nitrosomonas eutropha]SDW58904.1 cell division protein FtsB [Nitrosomonas eutropha]SEI90870.1 cell division protein FtsB [Nitrosomonas eutropha]